MVTEKIEKRIDNHKGFQQRNGAFVESKLSCINKFECKDIMRKTRDRWDVPSIQVNLALGRKLMSGRYIRSNVSFLIKATVPMRQCHVEVLRGHSPRLV
jgi:hypothetical protein